MAVATCRNPELSPARKHLVETQTFAPNTRGWGRPQQATECRHMVSKTGDGVIIRRKRIVRSRLMDMLLGFFKLQFDDIGWIGGNRGMRRTSVHPCCCCFKNLVRSAACGIPNSLVPPLNIIVFSFMLIFCVTYPKAKRSEAGKQEGAGRYQ